MPAGPDQFCFLPLGDTQPQEPHAGERSLCVRRRDTLLGVAGRQVWRGEWEEASTPP